MKKTITAIFLFGTIIIYAQSTPNQVEKQMFKINLLTPGLEYEVGLTKNTSLDFTLGTGLAYVKTNNDEEFGVFLTFEGDYRYYYNLEKRASKGKKTSGNSANYIALTSLYTNGNPIIGDVDVVSEYIVQVGPVWGFQRTYKSNFNLGLELGLGGTFENNRKEITPIIGFKLGWVFGK